MLLGFVVLYLIKAFFLFDFQILFLLQIKYFNCFDSSQLIACWFGLWFITLKQRL